MAGTHLTTTGAVGGGDLRAAAEEIASGARAIAARFSKQIPPDIKVEVAGNTATISCEVGPAYPAETRSRHPLFARGPRDAPGAGHKGWGHWYGPPGEPFLAPAADERAGAAMARYSRKVDRMLREAGFR